MYFLDNQHKLEKKGNQYKNRIIFYQEEEIKNEHLITTSDKIHESSFFESLFNSIKLEIKDIQESYRRYMQESVPYYKQIEANVNEKLKKINKQFNDLCHKKDDEQPNDLDIKNNETYRFEIKMESQQIVLILFKDNHIINLESQSVGFRKFFNLFFKLYNGKTKLKKGDIILIDEAETHLSVPAQIEFRDFLKSFGMQNGLLFVITTHSPFMLDIKYLDEIRILKTKDDGLGTKIINDFSFIDKKESEQANTLLKMKDALGVEYFHLLNPNSKPIFVEGITDYNYLTAFTLLYNYDHKDKEIDIVFLPISGLGKKDEEQTTSKSQRSEVLDSLDKFSQKLCDSPAILLADSDDAAKEVRELSKQNHKKIKVILLNDVPKIRECFKDFEEVEIENLFTNTDRLIHYAIKNTKEIRMNKIQQQSSYFKSKVKLFIDEQSKKESDRKTEIELNISKETKDNFYEVLKYLHYIAQKHFLNALRFFYEQAVDNAEKGTTKDTKIIEIENRFNEVLEVLGLKCAVGFGRGKTTEQHGIAFVRKDTLGKEYINGETPSPTRGIYLWFCCFRKIKDVCLEFGFSMEKERWDCAVFDKMKGDGCFGDNEGRFGKLYPDFENHKDAILNDFLNFVSYYKSFDARDFRIQPTTGA